MSGSAKIYRIGPDGKERVLHVGEANDSFAEAALFTERYPAPAEALGLLTLLEVSGARFCEELRRDTRLALKVIRAVVV